MKITDLTGKARERAIKKLAQWQVDDVWWENEYEHAKTEAAKRGMHIDTIDWEGFYRQGSYATWAGYVNVAEWIEWRKPNAGSLLPHLMVLEALVRDYVDNTVQVYAPTRRMVIQDFDCDYRYPDDTISSGPYKGADVNELIEALDWASLSEALRHDCEDMAQEIYDSLQAEYEYLTSEEACIEMAEANDYDFDEEGNLQ
jgi:hypothetical protein